MTVSHPIGWNVLDYSANADNGSTDALPAIMAAVSAASAHGGVVYLPAPRNRYLCSAAITINAPGISFVGDGRSLLARSGSDDLIRVNANSFSIEGVYLTHQGAAPSAGAAINLASGSGATIEGCIIADGFYDNISTLNASAWSIRNNVLDDPLRYNVHVRNSGSPDNGDSTIFGNMMATGRPSQAAIRYESSGGLRVVNNKMLGHAYQIDLQVADGATTGVLIASANSMEGAATSLVRLGRLGTTGSFGKVIITSNEFAGVSHGVQFGAGIDGLVINDNSFTGAPGFIGIDCQSGGNFANIGGNQFTDYDVAVRMSGATNVALGVNQYRGAGALTA